MIMKSPNKAFTNLLITLFLPLGNQVGIGIIILKQPVVQLLGDSLFLIVEVIDIS